MNLPCRQVISLHCPGAPRGLSIARLVVSQESFLRHFPAKQGNPWRNDDILEALADFGIKALVGWALIDFSWFFICQLLFCYLEKREKWMSTCELSKQKEYPNWKLEWRWMKYVYNPDYQMWSCDLTSKTCFQISKAVLTKVHTSGGKISRLEFFRQLFGREAQSRTEKIALKTVLLQPQQMGRAVERVSRFSS